jgi:DNA-binding CsgD family transcriptional regulator
VVSLPFAAALRLKLRIEYRGHLPELYHRVARQREVLTHLSGMRSTAEIATEMYLSVNTVKTHLRSIYRKLSAAHRSEAVRRARQLGLIRDCRAERSDRM